MALIYPTIWELGDKREQLVPGYHYKKHVQSLVVPEGQVVTIYENQDRQGRKSLPFNEGAYHHLSFYGISDKPGVIHVEENDLTSLDLVEIGWWATYDENRAKETGGKEGRYPMAYAIPIGDRTFGEDFPNDKIQWLDIPFGVTVEVFDQGDFKGGSLIFSGNKVGEKERVNLWDYGYSWKTSSMRIRADTWVSAGVALENEVITEGKKVAATTEISNNSPHTATASKEISCSVEETVAENWNIEAGVTAKVGFEAGPEVCKVTGEVEVSVSGGYGEEKATAKSKGFSDIASVELVGYGKAKVSMIVETGQMEADAIRKWRNKRNNVIIEQRGKISASWANKSLIEVH